MGSRHPRSTVAPSTDVRALPSAHQLKQQARRLREAAADRGARLSHSDTLELLARVYGASDWNTLHALSGDADRPGPCPVDEGRGLAPWRVGQAVAGRYMGQPFTGRLVGLSLMPREHFRVSVHVDEPVDPVEFESFSAPRRRLNAVVTRGGVSRDSRSDGVSHLVLEALPGATSSAGGGA